jgi:hypothetical protein
MTRLDLDLKQFGITARVSLNEDRDNIIGEMFLRLRADLLYEKQDPILYTTPKTWVDAAKEHFYPKCPAWLRRQVQRRWPVEYKKHAIDWEIIYTTAKVSLPPAHRGPTVAFAFASKGVFSRFSDTPLSEFELVEKAHALPLWSAKEAWSHCLRTLPRYV